LERQPPSWVETTFGETLLDVLGAIRFGRILHGRKALELLGTVPECLADGEDTGDWKACAT
jgi:hypothetical protein